MTLHGMQDLERQYAEAVALVAARVRG